jgi:hypothetical protein
MGMKVSAWDNIDLNNIKTQNVLKYSTYHAYNRKAWSPNLRQHILYQKKDDTDPTLVLTSSSYIILLS